MKSFFIALILGIFIGSIATNYLASPDAYEKLKESKAELFEQPGSHDTPASPDETEDPTPDFEVGDGTINSDTPADEAVPTPPGSEPEIETEPDAAPEAEPETEAEAETPPIAPIVTPPSEEPEPSPEPSPTTEESAETPVEEAPAETEDNLPVPAPTPEPPEPEAPEPEPETNEEAPPPVPETENEESDATETTEEEAESATLEIGDAVDRGIAATIRSQFELEEQLVSDDLEIIVEARHVVLKGKVPTEEAKRLAIEIAVFSEGVEGVEESLTIEP